MKLTPDQVRQIRAEYRVEQKASRSAVNVIELAKRFGVSQLTIRKVATGITYKDVK